MSTKDLIPLGQPGNEERDKRVRAKLKGSSSQKRKNAQQIAAVKKCKPENRDKKILALATNPNLSSIEILKMLEDFKDLKMEQSTRLQLINTAIKAHTMIYGTTSKNLNLNINRTVDSAERANIIYYDIIAKKRKNGKDTSG